MDIQARLEQTQQSLQQEIQQLQQSLQAPIVEKANTVINDLAKAKGVAAVFDKSTFLYVDDGPYIAYNGKNYRLPKGTKVEALTYVDCQRIVAKSKK